MISIFAFAWLLQNNSGVQWDDVRTILSALTVAGMLGLIKLVMSMRDDVRDTKREVGNEKEGTGLLGRMNKLDMRVKHIEERNIRLDAVYADYVRDVQAHEGPERRRSGHKIRQSLRASLEEAIDAENDN